MATLADRLGHTFANPALLKLALTHRSVSSDDPARNDNERLEFLGDAVLQLVITDLLYERYPHLAEGQLAKVRAAVVSRAALAEVARNLDLGTFVELSPSEAATGGRGKDSILADAVEAVIGAVYLDGGLEPVADMINELWAERVADRAKSPGVKDYKTRLQELTARNGSKPVYDVAGTGPDHDRRFQATVMVDGTLFGTGEGRSKKQAEQAAAAQAIAALTPGPR